MLPVAILPRSQTHMNARISLTILLLLASVCWVKADRIKKAYQNLQKNRLEQVRPLLRKELSKNPQSAGAKYVYGLYFLHPQNPQRHLDSAYAFVMAAQTDFPQADKGDRKSWAKIGLTEATLLQKKAEIDSLAFAIAADSNQIAAYQYFIDHYPTAGQVADATERRNAIAFEQARQANTYERYKKFLDTYPDARQAKSARELYDLLLFEFQTSDKDISSYENFITLYPDSPFRGKAEQHIFELFTAVHTLKTYQDFIKQYPGNPFVTRAWQWMYFLFKQERPAHEFLAYYPDFYDAAYLKKLAAAEKLTFFPVYEEEKYGFLDVNGAIQIPVQYDSVATDYFCEGVKEDFIKVYWQGKLFLLDKTGKSITDSVYAQIEPMETGLLKVSQHDKFGVIHEAGFPVLPVAYDEVELLDDVFLQVWQGEKTGLATANGRLLTSINFDEISSSGDNLLVFKQGDKYAILPFANLLQSKDTALHFQYDQVEWVKQGYVKVRAGDQQAIFDTQLKPVIPLMTASISPLPTGWTVNNGGAVRVFKSDGQLLSDSAFAEVTSSSSFYAVRKSKGWSVLRANGTWVDSTAFDEVTLFGDDLFTARRRQTLYVNSRTGKLIKLGNFIKASLQKLPDYSRHAWLVLQNKAGKKGLYASATDLLLSPRFDDIQVWEPELYKIEVNGKYGLINSKGKPVLPPVYDGLDYQPDGTVALLKAQKFGILNRQTSVTIKPQYSTLVKKYDEPGKAFIASKDGKYGLISAKNEPLTEFVYDEIRYWQPDVALVKQGQTWQLYHLTEKRFTFSPMDFIQPIKEDRTEILLKVYMNKSYGILSNTRGMVVSCEYDDLRNVGTPELPLYVGEKYVRDADVYLVFYIDREGKAIRRQLFNQNRYNRIVCE